MTRIPLVICDGVAGLRQRFGSEGFRVPERVLKAGHATLDSRYSIELQSEPAHSDLRPKPGEVVMIGHGQRIGRVVDAIRQRLSSPAEAQADDACEGSRRRG
jgi:hypothetical protein